jgi:hypothetical protein
VLRREARQRLKCGHWHAAAIEPKHEFIDVVRQVLRADAVVRALEPGLEVREGPVDAREELGRILGITHRGGSIIVGLVEWGISLPSIHQQCAPWCHRRLDKWNQRRRGEILDHGEPDAAGAASYPQVCLCYICVKVKCYAYGQLAQRFDPIVVF